MSKANKARLDNTANHGGQKNMSPCITHKPGWVENLIDEFVRDRWISPDDRWQEISNIYRGQVAESDMALQRVLLRAEYQHYAKGWVHRYQDQLEELRGEHLAQLS